MATNQKSHQKDQSQQARKNKKPAPQAVQQLNHQQMLDAPETMHQEDVLAAQQQLGNQVVQRALDKKQRRKSLTDGQGFLRSEISDTIQEKRGGGSPLPDTVRRDAGKRFKKDFEDVRLHTDDTADKLSRTIKARAFTIGKDIFFKKGVFAPGSSQGRETLMHELTHVVQQSGSKGFSGRLKLGAPDTTHEQQADRIGKQNSSSEAIKAGSAPGSGVQTFGEEEEQLQMQEMDEEELQMQEMDEEELQMQEMDEEELQMQPDTVGVVQRSWFTDIFTSKEKKRKKKRNDDLYREMEDQVAEEMGKLSFEDESEFDEDDVSESRPVPTSQPIKKDLDAPLTEEPIKKRAPMQKLSGELEPEEPIQKKAPLEKIQEAKRREELVATLKDPTKSREKVLEAKQQLKDLHTSKKSSLMDYMFPKKSERYGEMMGERTKALKEGAKTGDPKAYKMWKEDQEHSTSAKLGRGLKQAGGFLGGMGKRFLGKFGDDVSGQLFGKAPKKEAPKKEAPAPSSTVNVMGGGGGGGFQMLEKYMLENQQLKAKIAELENDIK